MGDAELVYFRYRGYLESTMDQLTAVRQAENRKDLKVYDRQIRRKLCSLIHRMWPAGYIEFWVDYDILQTARPIWARLYRLYLELTKS